MDRGAAAASGREPSSLLRGAEGGRARARRNGIPPPTQLQRPDQADRVRINHQIRLSPVRLVDPDGNQLGIVPVEEARAKAEALGLDLVEVNPSIRPIVCRIMDYGRFKYDKQKNERKSKSAASELKQIKYRPAIDDHDFEVKTEKLRRFLSQGNKVRVTVMFRRRDMRRPENGIRVLDRVAQALADVGRVEDAPAPGEIARDLTMTLSPLRQPAKKPAAPAAPAKEQRLRRHEREAARVAAPSEDGASAGSDGGGPDSAGSDEEE